MRFGSRSAIFLAIVVICGLGERAQAQLPTVDVSINLRYNHPAKPEAGGRFYVVVQSNATSGPAGTNGLAGLRLHISNIDGPGTVFGVATYGNGYSPISREALGHTLANGIPYVGTAGEWANLAYGQDPALPKITDIGKGSGTPGVVTADPLKNNNWSNSTLLFSGLFGSSRPVFGAGNEAEVYLGAEISPADLNLSVRGDSVISLGLNTPTTTGLRPGDATRDFVVGAADFTTLAANFGYGPDKTWNQGDFTGDGVVGPADYNLLAANFANNSPSPTYAIPEPRTIALMVTGLWGCIAARRRSRFFAYLPRLVPVRRTPLLVTESRVAC